MRKGFNRCRGRDFCDKFVNLLEQMELTPFQREVIISRFVTEVSEIEFDYTRSTILFIGLTNLVTVAGILITSFTTLTKAISVDAYWQNVLSWMVWTLSLALTLANGWLTTFGIYKKYVLNDVTLEKMYNEGWSFIAGVNRYEKLAMDERVSVFCSKIEQIITKTTIKQLSDNTAGVNVHDVLEAPPEENAAVDGAVSGAQLTGAQLTGAQLTGAQLTGAQLTGAQLTDNGTDVQPTAKDTVIVISSHTGLRDNIAPPRRKKKIRSKISSDRPLLDQ